jgi:hypothetical protein
MNFVLQMVKCAFSKMLKAIRVEYFSNTSSWTIYFIYMHVYEFPTF